VPIAFAVGGVTFMTTWHTGRAHLHESIRRTALPLSSFLDLAQKSPHRVRGMLRISGTAIFLTSTPEGAPPTLLHYLVHHKVLHEKVVILSIQSRHVPEIAASARIEELYDLGLDVYQVVAAYGFMETPNVIDLLELCRKRGLEIDLNEASYFLGRETLILTDQGTMARWRKRLFSYMSRNARPANAFFQIPSSRVVELGTHIEL
jgi:KUP system potassium uptake protein